MEVRVTAKMEGHRFRDRILERWGSRQRLETEAEQGSAEAEDDLFTLRRLEENPDRLEAELERETITELEPEELSGLTGKRLALVDEVAAAQRPLNVSELARRVGRDKKNISEDVALLDERGLLERVVDGREKKLRLRGSRITIELVLDEPLPA